MNRSRSLRQRRSHAIRYAVLALAAACSVPSFVLAQSYSGSAFEVSDEGHLLTNHHVVASCKSIHIKRNQLDDLVDVVASDTGADLALLFDPGLLTDRIAHRRMFNGARLPYAHFSADKSSLLFGESVIVAGFPLPDYIGGVNVTTGTVSAMTGPGNDQGLFQITAPVQGGNSGGPVLDRRGNVVGVVVATLDPIKLQKYAGVVPQNVNFAIQGSIAREFVRKTTGKVAIDDSTTARELATTTIAAFATQIVFQVLCLN